MPILLVSAGMQNPSPLYLFEAHSLRKIKKNVLLEKLNQDLSKKNYKNSM